MLTPQTLTSAQKITVGVAILDQGGETFATLPPGVVVTIESSNPSVVGVQMQPDGMNAVLTSDDIGESLITVRTTKDGVDLLDSPESAVVTVVNSEPGSQNAAFGSPEPE